MSRDPRSQVVLSLRSRHADLLRRYPTTPATADRLVEATRKEIPPHRGAEETPVRLVTNGLWPLVASRNGSGPAAAEFGQGLPAIARPMDKEGGEGGRGGVGVGSNFRATCIAMRVVLGHLHRQEKRLITSRRDDTVESLN